MKLSITLYTTKSTPQERKEFFKEASKEAVNDYEKGYDQGEINVNTSTGTYMSGLWERMNDEI